MRSRRVWRAAQRVKHLTEAQDMGTREPLALGAARPSCCLLPASGVKPRPRLHGRQAATDFVLKKGVLVIVGKDSGMKEVELPIYVIGTGAAGQLKLREGRGAKGVIGMGTVIYMTRMAIYVTEGPALCISGHCLVRLGGAACTLCTKARAVRQWRARLSEDARSTRSGRRRRCGHDHRRGCTSLIWAASAGSSLPTSPTRRSRETCAALQAAWRREGHPPRRMRSTATSRRTRGGVSPTTGTAARTSMTSARRRMGPRTTAAERRRAAGALVSEAAGELEGADPRLGAGACGSGTSSLATPTRGRAAMRQFEGTMRCLGPQTPPWGPPRPRRQPG